MSDDRRRPRVIVLPEIGEGVTEATVGRRLKRVGDAVKKDEPVLEIETDKVTIELAAPEDGLIGSIAPESQVIRVGGPIYTLHVGKAGPAGFEAPAWPQPPGPSLSVWQQTWDAGRVLARAGALSAGADRGPAERALLATALVRALAATPGVLAMVGEGAPFEVIVEFCDVSAGGAQWSHLPVRPDTTIEAALAGLRTGRRPDARVTVIRTAAPDVIATTPSAWTRLTVAIGAVRTQAVVEDGAIVARTQATLTIALGKSLPAEQALAFAEALGEQLQAV